MWRWTALALPLLLAGCVERILAVRSDPPGATVFVDGERAGETPCDVRYVWYGARTVTVEKTHYRSATRTVKLEAPWYQVFPFDFLTDVVIPLKITDRDEISFMLEQEPAEGLDRKAAEEILKRAAELREKAAE